jgi:hypothetical protein
MKMQAAVVTSFTEPPHYQSFDAPTPHGDDEVDVVAVARRGGGAGRRGDAGVSYAPLVEVSEMHVTRDAGRCLVRPPACDQE